jgi:hypothetical protein
MYKNPNKASFSEGPWATEYERHLRCFEKIDERARTAHPDATGPSPMARLLKKLLKEARYALLHRL